MACTPINSEDRLVQETFEEYLRDTLGWDSVYAWNNETFGPDGSLGRDSERDVVLKRDLRAAIARLNPTFAAKEINEATEKLTAHDVTRSTLQHNRDFYRFIRDGVPVTYRDKQGAIQETKAKVLDFRDFRKNRFLAVRELKIQGLRSPHYNRRADLVCFINGLPVVFIELKAVYVNIRDGFDNNLTDYKDTIPHAFHHNGFLIVSNGDRARYGSITSEWEHFCEWKRNDEAESGTLEAKALLDGMLDRQKLLDLLESFILFDASKPGGTRKIVARNQQVLGVNRAVESVIRQEDLKRQFPVGERVKHYEVLRSEIQAAADIERERDLPTSADPAARKLVQPAPDEEPKRTGVLPLVKRAHPDLGRLGVFWHTQGSGKSYSMAFFAEKVRRTVTGNFTFVLMTDREDLDDQLYKTFVGCSVADEETPRAASGRHLEALLKEDHRFVFTLIQKFRREEAPKEPYSARDDIIVVSDEAHRTQAGKLARNMRLALPNAAFIGFTGTPLFRHDHLTRRVFGDYISRYDFRRSEQDGATVKLVYENRGEKLGLRRIDLNDAIAEKVEEADLDPDQIALLEKLLGRDYEVITADDRLDKMADDFVEHCSKRSECGKAMLVCIDKVTCARMYQRIIPRWDAKLEALRRAAEQKEAEVGVEDDLDRRELLQKELAKLQGRAQWMEETRIQIVISEGQNEVRDFRRWEFDIRPHRALIKQGFELPGGRTLAVDDAFKDADHPFRIAIVCAMWLTGFDVECLSTLYIDKPMKAHTLMQAIARANRVYPGKRCGVIVDYNGILRSLREALAEYALGDGGDDGSGEGGGTGEGGGPGEGEVLEPLEVMIAALEQAIEAAEDHLRGLGFDPSSLIGARGFEKIQALRDAVNVLYSSDDAKRRFEIMAREVLARMKVLVAEPASFAYAERHDNLEAIYRKLEERRDTSDVTEVLKELHRIVNEAIRAQGRGDDQAEALTVDLNRINFERLRDEFAKKVHRKQAVLKDIRDLVEDKLQKMIERNPMLMDYYLRYQEIIAAYNRDKDRISVEEAFAQLLEFSDQLDAEQRRTAEEGLTEEERALFDMLSKDDLSKKDRETLKQASKRLLAALRGLLEPLKGWTEKEQTRAEVEVFILDRLFEALPNPPYTENETQAAATRIYDYIWQRSATGSLFGQPAA